MEHSDPLWWIQPKIEETEEECEARLRKISEDLKAHYRIKKNPPPMVMITSLADEIFLHYRHLVSADVELEIRRESLQKHIPDKIQLEIPQKKRGFYEHLQHPRNPKHRF